MKEQWNDKVCEHNYQWVKEQANKEDLLTLSQLHSLLTESQALEWVLQD